MASPVIEAYEGRPAAAREAADAIAAALAQAIRERGEAVFIATGGHSPGPIYDVLARVELPWDKVRVTLTDERWVDPHSPQSNERLVRERLLVEQAAAARLTPLKSDHQTPEAAVPEAEARLEPLLPADVTLLGMGEDGHVGSLFPDSGKVEAKGVAVGVEQGAPQPRLSLTLDALQPRRLTVIPISGEAKRRALEGDGLPVHAYLARTKAPVRVMWSP